jgi:hypothetical protein
MSAVETSLIHGERFPSGVHESVNDRVRLAAMIAGCGSLLAYFDGEVTGSATHYVP